MLDSIYHMTLKLIKIAFLSLNVKILPSFMQVYTGRFPEICKPLVVYQFYCIALYHSQTQRIVINCYACINFTSIWFCLDF